MSTPVATTVETRRGAADAGRSRAAARRRRRQAAALSSLVGVGRRRRSRRDARRRRCRSASSMARRRRAAPSPGRDRFSESDARRCLLVVAGCSRAPELIARHPAAGRPPSSGRRRRRSTSIATRGTQVLAQVVIRRHRVSCRWRASPTARTPSSRSTASTAPATSSRAGAPARSTSCSSGTTAPLYFAPTNFFAPTVGAPAARAPIRSSCRSSDGTVLLAGGAATPDAARQRRALRARQRHVRARADDAQSPRARRPRPCSCPTSASLITGGLDAAGVPVARAEVFDEAQRLVPRAPRRSAPRRALRPPRGARRTADTVLISGGHDRRPARRSPRRCSSSCSAGGAAVDQRWPAAGDGALSTRRRRRRRHRRSSSAATAATACRSPASRRCSRPTPPPVRPRRSCTSRRCASLAPRRPPRCWPTGRSSSSAAPATRRARRAPTPSCTTRYTHKTTRPRARRSAPRPHRHGAARWTRAHRRRHRGRFAGNAVPFVVGRAVLAGGRRLRLGAAAGRAARAPRRRPACATAPSSSSAVAPAPRSTRRRRLALEAVLLELVDERAPRQAEPLGRARLIAALGRQRLLDAALLEVGQLIADGARRRSAPPRDAPSPADPRA